MIGVNKAIIVGNLGADPDMRQLQNGDPVANLSVATAHIPGTEKGPQTTWHRVVMFGRLAEIAGEYLRKGSKVYIEGRIQHRKWEDKDGVMHHSSEIVSNQMQMLSSRDDATPAPAEKSGYDDDDIPF